MHDETTVDNEKIYAPLARKLRPLSLDKYVGQHHLLDKGKLLRRLIDSDTIPSMIFWGPPGVGKTTLAQVIAEKTKSDFVSFSAASCGIKEVRVVMEDAEHKRLLGSKTIIFIDEIHRFNKAQQDVLLPYVENGSVILIGATTENPSFEINSALISRCKIFILHALSSSEISILLQRAIDRFSSETGFNIEITDKLMGVIATFSNGDARVALNTIEMILNSAPICGVTIKIDNELVEQCISKKILFYDKNGDEHYNLTSALNKSMRNSDVNASIYWLTRMLESGEEPLYIARRITRFASEDIGMADSNALQVAVSAYQACHFIGMPECGIHLTHAVTYCALAPKSNSLYIAYESAMSDSQRLPTEPVPLALRNASTRLMKDLHFGDGYQYAHDTENKITNMQCLPDRLVGRTYYNPTNQGREIRIKEWMEKIEELRKVCKPRKY